MTVTQNSKKTANLKPFKKGQSGNPGGRPKKIPQLEVLWLRYACEPDMDGVTPIEKIIQSLIENAIAHDQKAIEYILNRIYGKPKESIVMTHSSSSEIDLSDDEKKQFIRRYITENPDSC